MINLGSTENDGTGDTLRSAGGKINGVILTGSEEVTSGASPVVCDATVALTLVTSGGTHGDEIVELDDLAFTLGGFARPEQYGARHVVALKTRTENDDVVKVRLNSGSPILIKDRKGNLLAAADDDVVVLDYEGATAVFEWAGEQWLLNHEDNNTSTAFTDVLPLLPALPDSPKDQILNSYLGTVLWSPTPAPGTLNALTLTASPTEIDHDQYTTIITTRGTAGTDIISLGNQNKRSVGTRHVIALDTKTDPADVLSLDVTNVKALDGSSVSSVTMDTEGQYLLLEVWTTSEWRILRGTATVT